jgi:hypothetical protein
MHLIMVKKKLKDGSDCRKCAEATQYLRSRGLWDKVDEVIWAHEGDPESPGMKLGTRLGVERAPFFVVQDESGEKVYLSVLQLVRDRFSDQVSTRDAARTVDADDIGGI